MKHWNIAILGLAVLFSIADLAAASGADGNPHNWDRRRRCDQGQTYVPACSVCEGYGGIPFGDKNSEIHLTTCEVIADAKSVRPGPRPVWNSQFTIVHYNEILIGPKRDPFCFETIPSNSSEGALCYRPDSGRQIYDAKKAKALRYDLDSKTKVGNFSSSIIHKGPDMWIVNHLPWYAASVHQCICTQVHAAGDPQSPKMYPIAYNWTQQLVFIGREKIGIEYMEPGHKEILDHWAFGPHHVWSTTDTGEIRRLWQPFNGLEVFPHGTSNQTIDEKALLETPPSFCVKGGSAFRIGCSDEGYPIPKNKTKSKSDEKRARQKKPGSAYRGDSFREMSKTLNGWLARSVPNGSAKSCAEFSAQELQDLQVLLYYAKDDGLDKVYREAGDNRQMQSTLEDLLVQWDMLNKLTENDHAQKEIQRDGHCHEAVMWFVHHLNEDARKVLTETPGIVLPLLSEDSHIGECSERASDDAHACTKYMEQVTCASCHSNVNPPPGHKFLFSF